MIILQLFKINYLFLSKTKNKIRLYMKLINALRIFVAILFLMSPMEILGEKVPKYTKMNHVNRKLEENDNYIIVKYGTKTTYEAGMFKNQHRQSVDHIKYKGKEIDQTQQFTIEANTNIEIYFSVSVTSLYGFFARYEDSNAEYITFIDLSHFDSSEVTDTDDMFNTCFSLEEINFNNFNTSKVTSMEKMFYGCTNLKSLDLSNFDTSKVQHSDSMFSGVNLLKYINLYNAQIDNIKNAILEIIEDSTIICQKDDFKIETDIDYIKACCDYNIETTSCDPDNYIKVKYKKDVTYSYGFSIIEYDKSENQYRPDIYLINNNNKRYKPNEALIIEKNIEIKILYNSKLKSLEKFFYDYYDPNVEYISSIDLTHFDSSSIESLESAFYDPKQ